MASPNKPLELFFTSSIYARGEHVIGENAVKDDGKPNMVLIHAGSTRKIASDAAKDLIIAGQAIDAKSASSSAMEDAKELVKIHNARQTKKAA